ncbi:Decarbamoylnovobiocin carbamoyltransferase [Nonomuraea coxensis DSM 45129]|uniref:Decarbamoylnovobiocin carbamoyltransferase n=1 Tax=Nonomuraea coxensis DSM 45129 TaxID=1122611 RepID=A0ABX8UGW6_9ACTN|nr:carbamoyltransferase C-terminal domain-containing protein [Nonomuraea coxensis]QYC45629.1 Decarbamoylnovobiocin carbamoyltransferase [Nonomuraea coxensis DSM 45129]
MADFPIVVGINRTQDGSIAVAVGDAGMYSLQKERITRRKHHWGRPGDLPDRYLPAMPLLKEPVDLVVEGYSSDAEIENLEDYHEELRESLSLKEDARIVQVSHHLSHLYSAFHPSPFEQAAGLVVDNQGSPVRRLTELFTPPPGASGDLLEVASFYRCTRDGVECLAKQLWHGDWADPAGLGCFYALLAKALWPEGEGNEGKVMGLAPYGDPDALGLPGLDVRGHEVLIPSAWTELFARREDFLYEPGGEPFRRSANLAAAGQRAFENALAALAEWLHARTGLDRLAFAGGTALNCSANGLLIRRGPFREVFVPPSPHDGGTAIGCALYGLEAVLGVRGRWRWDDDFLGPDPDESEITAAVGSLPDGLVAEQPEDLIAAMVALLEDGRVVGLHQGRSESGPRALGHRSIIGDPRRPDIQDYVNYEVKGREWFRPLAPLVLAEHAQRFFDVDRPAPFMQYAVDVRPECRELLPGITHVDGTTRLQTVEPGRTPFLHALLTRWYERTGLPVLINTSLNGPGRPLTETPEHSIDTLRTTGMHALVMPPYLIRKVG